MPKLNKYQIRKNERLKIKVRKLYKQGLSTREIRDLIKNEKSHAWIALVVKGV